MPATTPWTVDWLKEVFLFGVDLTDDNGTAYPDSMFTQAMGAALEWVKTNLDISVPKTTYVERHDFSEADLGDYWMFKTDHAPVRAVTKFELKVGPTLAYTVPASWIQAPAAGSFSNMIQIVPAADTTGTWADAVYAIQTIMASSRWGRLPGWYVLTYDAGWETSELPYDVLDLAGKYASCYPLNTAGDLIAGAGIASKSTSMDGVSSSVSTTASATNAGYGARIIQYRQDIKKDLPRVRAKYHGMQIVVV